MPWDTGSLRKAPGPGANAPVTSLLCSHNRPRTLGRVVAAQRMPPSVELAEGKGRAVGRARCLPGWRAGPGPGSCETACSCYQVGLRSQEK